MSNGKRARGLGKELLRKVEKVEQEDAKDEVSSKGTRIK